MPGWILVCIPIAAAAVAVVPAIKPRPRLLHPAPKPARPVLSHPRVPEALARRPRVVRPRPRPAAVPVAAAPACYWYRAPGWYAGVPGGFAPGWWPGYAPAYGPGWGAYGPAFPMAVGGGAWGGPGWGGGIGGGWIGGPGYAAVPYPVPVVAPAYAFASAEANALALAVVVVTFGGPGGSGTGPGSGPFPGDTLAPGPLPPGVDVGTGTLPPGVLPPGPQDVPAPPSLAVALAGLFGLAWTRRART